MFDFVNANASQREAITSTEGPLLIIAGPGTGKTFTLVKRTLYLITEKKVKPENILITTFTKKAANELVTRISDELMASRLSVNVRDMYVGTFDSLCQRIIEKHLESTHLHKNYVQLDMFGQKYLVYKNIERFRSIPGVSRYIDGKGSGAWAEARAICRIVDSLSNELIRPGDLLKDGASLENMVLGTILYKYLELLREGNLADFNSIKREAYYLLLEHPDILAAYQEQFRYLMVDEYQDTNYVQELFLFLLGKKYQNICVVGDDDQGLYRFRGATIQNILEFPQKFLGRKCPIITLSTNYRSNSGIISFCREWMKHTSGQGFHFEWGRYRYTKNLKADEGRNINTPSVVTISGNGYESSWQREILSFLRRLKESGSITDFNQVAFLFRSVKSKKVRGLLAYLEANGIHVYSPRSAMFFKRNEIRLLMGCLLWLFPEYASTLESKESYGIYNYYRDYRKYAGGVLKKHPLLAGKVRKLMCSHTQPGNAFDYTFSGLVYRLFAFDPFESMLDVPMVSNVTELRASRNLSKFIGILTQFEKLYHIEELKEETLLEECRKLFDQYLPLVYEGWEAQYENDEAYAPGGCVSFLTFHQAKGMEYPVVIVGSLEKPFKWTDNDILGSVLERYQKGGSYEPEGSIRYFDYWRLYYTAFSRAENILALTAEGNPTDPGPYFADLYDKLPEWKDPEIDYSIFHAKPVKEMNLRRDYSFTSHVNVYNACPRRYKFYKELGFVAAGSRAMLFGTLIHETLEDMNHEILEKKDIKPERIRFLFYRNYRSLSQASGEKMSQELLDRALGEVMNYAEKSRDRFPFITGAEVDISLTAEKYSIIGTADLILEKDGQVEIVDFKSEKRPHPGEKEKRLHQYINQLTLYGYLVEKKLGKPVAKLTLYFLGEKDNPEFTWEYSREEASRMIKNFDQTVRHIHYEDVEKKTEDRTVCRNCDFKYYCHRDK